MHKDYASHGGYSGLVNMPVLLWNCFGGCQPWKPQGCEFNSCKNHQEVLVGIASLQRTGHVYIPEIPGCALYGCTFPGGSKGDEMTRGEDRWVERGGMDTNPVVIENGGVLSNSTAIATEKPRPDGLALACQNLRLDQSHWKAITLAWPIWVQLGLASGGWAHH